MTARICIVEDDRTLRESLTEAFELDGHVVEGIDDGDSAASRLESGGFDLVILDGMLPGRDGFEILEELRARGDATPVLMLTVRGAVDDKVRGLELGADDYLTKPFHLRELRARAQALLRRLPEGEGSVALVLSFGEVEVDLGRYEVRRNGGSEALSPKEAEIIRILHGAGGRPISREEFLTRIWGDDPPVGPRTIDTHILNLRQKLEVDSTAPRHLVTAHGVGYRLLLD